MKTNRIQRFASFALTALLLFQAVAPALAREDDGRIKPAKSKDKDAKHGSIEIKNDTGQEANDFHIAFRPSLPTIEKIGVNGKDPFPSGYRPRGTSPGTGPAYADFGRQKGDGSVKDGDTIKIDIAWTGEMPEIAYFVWTKDGEKLTAKDGAAEQKPEIKGRDADKVREAKKKAEEEAAKRAKEEEAKAAKEAEKQAKKDAKKAKTDKGIQHSQGGLTFGSVRILFFGPGSEPFEGILRPKPKPSLSASKPATAKPGGAPVTEAKPRPPIGQSRKG